MNSIVKRVKPEKRFFTTLNGEVKAYTCSHVNVKSLVGINLETNEKARFCTAEGISQCGEKIIFTGIVPSLYDKLLSDAIFWVKTASPARISI